MRCTLVACLAHALSGTPCCALDANESVASVDTVAIEGIRVAFSGPLSVGYTFKPGADPATKFLEVAAKELRIATVQAGGTTIHLDWSRSAKIRNELLVAAADFGDGGPNSMVHAAITGRMVFKPLRALSYRLVPNGVTEDTPVPVVIVESIRLRFLRSDGRPRGAERRLVEAD